MFNLFSNHLILTCSRRLPQPVLLIIVSCILFHLICLSTFATIGCSASLFTPTSSPSIKHSILPCLFVASATATHYSQQDQQSSQNCPIMTDKKMERTFIAIKPDGVQRGLIGTIIERFERRGYKLIALKMVQPSRQHLEVHYQDLKTKPFFPHLIEYMLSGPIVAMVWQGLDIVRQGRVMIGATNPLESAPGSLRGDFAIQTGRNIVHGSDAIESAMREIAHWFRDDELNDYVAANMPLIYE